MNHFELQMSYPKPLPDQFIVAELDFLSPKRQYYFCCRPHLQKHITNKSHALLVNARDMALVTKAARNSMHKDQQGHL